MRAGRAISRKYVRCPLIRSIKEENMIKFKNYQSTEELVHLLDSARVDIRRSAFSRMFEKYGHNPFTSSTFYLKPEM